MARIRITFNNRFGIPETVYGEDLIGLLNSLLLNEAREILEIEIKSI